VQDILDQYGVESYEKGRARVQLAILKVFQEGTTGQESGEQKLERLRGLVRAAKCDYRDVLAWAEYPEQIKMGFIEMKKLTPQEGKALRKRDREQYLRWLNET
jgi:hypothetical protein